MYKHINKAKLCVSIGRKATGLYPFLEIAELPAYNDYFKNYLHDLKNNHYKSIYRGIL